MSKLKHPIPTGIGCFSRFVNISSTKNSGIDNRWCGVIGSGSSFSVHLFAHNGIQINDLILCHHALLSQLATAYRLSICILVSASLILPVFSLTPSTICSIIIGEFYNIWELATTFNRLFKWWQFETNILVLVKIWPMATNASTSLYFVKALFFRTSTKMSTTTKLSLIFQLGKNL